MPRETVPARPAATAAGAATGRGNGAGAAAGRGTGTNTPTAGNTATLPSRPRGGIPPGQASAGGNAPQPGPPGNKPPPAGPSRGSSPPVRPGSSGTNPSRPGSSGGFDLNNFSYYKHEGEFGIPINSDSIEFRLIADAYHIGWQRFNHPETKKELILFGKTCAETWTDPVKKKHYGNYTWPGNKSNMDQYLDNFLNGLITTTPALIKIQTDSSRTIYATTRLENTYAGSLDRVLATRGLFHIRIPDVFPEHLVDAYNKHEDERYQELRMTLGVSFFHELVHAWVYFLAGPVTEDSHKARTPPEYKAAWEETDELVADVGESGDYFEGLILGASVGLDPYPKPLGEKQKRTQLLCRDEWEREAVIPADVAKAFNKNPKDYNIKAQLLKLFKPRTRKSSGSDEQPAKKRKIKHVEVNPGRRNKMHAWHITFQYNSDHSSVIGLSKAEAPPV